MRKFWLGVLLFLTVIVLAGVIFEKTYPYPSQIKYGVTFSPRFAAYLKLDWRKIYLQSLDDLQVKNFRIPTYWDVLEPKPGQYDFSEVDFMLDEAAKRQAEVILVIGARQPRWPECHLPAWVRALNLPERRQKTLQFIQKTVERYADHPAVWAWQVENEPLLGIFGEGCDPVDVDFLSAEVSLVRSLSSKTIIVSDSGELGLGIVPMQLADIFGTTLYREVYNPYMGYLTYPFLPYFYYLKSYFGKFFAPHNQKTIIIELQAEPWSDTGNVPERPLAGIKRLPLKKLISYLDFAKKTGFEEIYLWGVEWWYFAAESGHPEYLNFAKTLFR